MPAYSFRCHHCDDIELDFPMEPGPPPRALCPLCGGLVTRVYEPVSIQYNAAGFTKSLADRPDERLKAEIDASKDVDVTTGLSWEETDKRLARRKGHYGALAKKTAVLPTGEPEGDPMQAEANRINRIVEGRKG